MKAVSGILVFSLAMLAGSAQAMLDRHFVTPVTESAWEAKSSPVGCHLNHVIANYGRAEFIHASGEPLRFHLHTDQRSHHEGLASLDAVNPAWKHDATPRHIAEVNLTQGIQPLSMQGSQARELLEELARGMFPTVSYTEEAIAGMRVRAAVSAVQFLPAFEEYLACEEQLINIAFGEVNDLLLVYGPGQKSIPEGKDSELADAVVFGKADPDLRGIRISSYTGPLGGAPASKAFKARANKLRDWFKKRGLKASQVRIEQGDRIGAVASGRDWLDIRLFGAEGVSRVHFPTGQHQLGSRARQGLVLLKDYMDRTGREGTLVMDGHTDNVGRGGYNRELSKRRAASVKAFLAEQGFAGGKLKTRWYGERRPLVSNRSASGRAQNRRVQIRLP